MNYPLAALISACLGAGSAWYVQEHRIDTLKLEQANDRITIQRQSRQTLERITQQRDQAQANGIRRAVDLRRTADDARNELDSLRESTDAALRVAAQSADASLAAATTATGLLNQCAAEYQALGERCDRHVSDIKTLSDFCKQ